MAEKLSEFFIHGLQVDLLIPASDCKQRCHCTVRDTLSFTAARDFVAGAVYWSCVEKFYKEK